nr:TlpA disulfide reductase family protein [uncultured Mucilaginibacter sp.]
MNHIIKKFIVAGLCVAPLLFGADVKGQASIVQNMAAKLKQYKSLSYKSFYKQKDETGDTLFRQNEDVLLKVPEEKDLGYYFLNRYKDPSWKFFTTDMYYGENFITLLPADSVYNTRKNLHTMLFKATLLFKLEWLADFVKKNPSRIAKAKDTVLSAVAYDHLIITTKDTVVNNERLVVNQHLLVDKQTGLPRALIIKGRHAGYGDGITSVYNELNFYDYQINDPGITIASFTIPKGFHPPKKQAAPPMLLAAGTIAPEWTLFDTYGKKMSLSDMKGKIVLMDFYFIGCGPCMQSLKPLNNLYKKYKDKLIIASLSDRDSKQAVTAFKKQYNIAYPGYVEATEAVKAYHVTGSPTFYFIDTKGNIASTILGYGDDTEAKFIAVIEDLLKKG